MGKALLSPDPTRLLSPSHSWVYDRFVLFPFGNLSLVSLASGGHSISMPFPFVQQARVSVACLSFHSSVTWLSSLLPGDARLPWAPKVLGVTRLKRKRGLGGMREGTAGEFGMDMYTLLCLRQDSQQGPPAQHGELCSMLRGSLDGRGVWERMDACMCMTEPLYCSPETIATLFVNQLYSKTK